MTVQERNEIFAKRLREMRIKRGLTQYELAEKCLFSKSAIGLLENCRIQPCVNTVNFIAKKLDCTIYDLLT